MDYLNKLDQIQQERFIFSDNDKNEAKLKEFKEYLVKSEAFLAITKFLVCLRNAQERPDDPLQALQEYFGSQKGENDELTTIKDECQELENQKKEKLQKIEDSRKQIEELKQFIEQKYHFYFREQEKREQEELEAQKNVKKGKK